MLDYDKLKVEDYSDELCLPKDLEEMSELEKMKLDDLEEEFEDSDELIDPKTGEALRDSEDDKVSDDEDDDGVSADTISSISFNFVYM